MSEEKTTLEMIAPTTEEAIERGLEQLGVREEDVDVEVLDSGNKGVLGLGTRQARVRITVKNDVTTLLQESASEIINEFTKEISGIENDSIFSRYQAGISDRYARARYEDPLSKRAACRRSSC